MATLLFFANLESLKTTRRKGWVIRGIEDGESVADHMYKMAMICIAYPWVSILFSILFEEAYILKLDRSLRMIELELWKWLSYMMHLKLLLVISLHQMESVAVGWHSKRSTYHC